MKLLCRPVNHLYMNILHILFVLFLALTDIRENKTDCGVNVKVVKGILLFMTCWLNIQSI